MATLNAKYLISQIIELWKYFHLVVTSQWVVLHNAAQAYNI